MQITVNGETRSFEAPIRLRDLLEDLQLGQRRVAVELNGDIVPRSRHDQTDLHDGDDLLIVHAIGGG
ncbi:MAG: sulfur carrier protein ThiS [Nevskiales bacterium]|nr:sulfur carrier protein ThiS [Nevskiales bacterium]